MSNFDCPICGTTFTRSHPYKLILHGETRHQLEPPRMFQCLEPGCERQPPALLPIQDILKHCAAHQRYREYVSTYEDRGTRPPTMLQLEEEEAPEVPFDEWLLDYAARYLFQFLLIFCQQPFLIVWLVGSNEMDPEEQLTTRPPPWDPEMRTKFHFLWVELKNSFTSKAHTQLVDFLTEYNFPVHLGSSPQILKEEAWRYFSSIGLGVCVFHLFFSSSRFFLFFYFDFSS